MTTTTAETPTSTLVQGTPQEQSQTSPIPGDPLPATAPDPTDASRPGPTSSTEDAEALAEKQRRRNELTAQSKTFGHIPDVPIFTHWTKRLECSNSAVHRSILKGICGNGKEGAYSVALSNKYKDNEDGGDVIIYTGAGGRERWNDAIPPKRLRLGPQTKDQSWEDSSNKALIVSFLTGNPVRLIRSWNSDSHYAPLKGYRYDGLYKVAAYWSAKGRNGKNICRCRLERLPDQPPIPLRPITLSTSRKRKERLVSGFACSPSSTTNTHDCSRETGVDTRSDQLSDSAVQMTKDEGIPKSQQEEMSETSTDVDFNMGDLEIDVKYPPPASSRPRTSPKPGSMPRYRWDRKTNELVRIPSTCGVPDSAGAAEEDEEDVRVADDATLVQSEDGHANERMETEFPSDAGDPLAQTSG